MERVWRALALFAAVLALGTLLYRGVEHMDWFDAFYTSLLSVTPLGHGLMPALTRSGREINAFMLICGVGVIGYAASIATRFVFEGEMGRVFWRRKVMRRAERMENHYIVCGHGRVGRIVARELEAHGVEFLVVEREEEAVRDRIAGGKDVILGDATDETVLEAAGVRRAQGLVAALESDADNLYVALTARGMNASLRIVARASDEDASAKLRRAGADRTVAPNIIGGREMAQHLLMPAVVDFLHLATGRRSLDLQLGEVHVGSDSPLSGVRLDESPLRQQHGVIVVAVARESGEPVFNPGGDFRASPGDVLICLGKGEALAAAGAGPRAPAPRS